MDNQHRKIKGYRELDSEEIALMNEIKEHGEKTAELLRKVTNAYEFECPLGRDTSKESYDEMSRCHTVAKQHLQEGQMWLVRAVARPDSF